MGCLDAAAWYVVWEGIMDGEYTIDARVQAVEMVSLSYETIIILMCLPPQKMTQE